jgi:predicted RNase H-like HicB family nuclease
MQTFYVWAKWDPEAGVWYTAECSIRGVNSSGDTLEELRERLLLLIPDFLEDQMPANAVLHIIAEREDELTPIAAE